ncbi:MAG: DUF1573 domain-containing protein [Bacteroidetes bacterium]|jgi:hypothetical protein|nr:DUF1573 domain-containing protein [Bacteroidota bacterium]
MRFVFILCSFFIFACTNDEGESIQTERSTELDEFIRIPTDKDGKIDPKTLPNLEFEEDHYTYDTLQEGDVIEHVFTFTNTGQSALLISSVKSSCGCTVADYPDAGIQPGETGEIKATFNSTDKKGPQINEINIYSNAYPNQHNLTISGYVLPND